MTGRETRTSTIGRSTTIEGIGIGSTTTAAGRTRTAQPLTIKPTVKTAALLTALANRMTFSSRNSLSEAAAPQSLADPALARACGPIGHPRGFINSSTSTRSALTGGVLLAAGVIRATIDYRPGQIGTSDDAAQPA